MPEAIGQFFPTQVPSYTEAADIRKAFNLYHYGTEEVPSSEENILPSSMAGYIRDTLQAVEDANIGATVVIPLDPTDDLNLLTTSGAYKSTANPNVADLHYPSTSAGVLNFWITSDNTYFQTYMSVVDNGFWWRTGTKPQATVVWSEWYKASVENHTHDSRYYTITQINNKFESSPLPNLVPVYNGATPAKLVQSSVTATELGYLSGTTGVVQDQLDEKALASHTHDDRYYTIYGSGSGKETARMFVKNPSEGNPIGAVAGDLWFW